MFNRRHMICLLGATLATPLHAGAMPYNIVPGSARIRFRFNLSGVQQSGTAPLSSAKIRIDPNQLNASTADVSADLSRATTGLFFATDALKSPSVLDTKRHPTARFRSTRVILGADGRISNGAALDGELTLRGTTRKVRFNATLTRPRGSSADDLSRLKINLTGAISRNAFGATGYPELVADRVGLTISTEIAAQA